MSCEKTELENYNNPNIQKKYYVYELGIVVKDPEFISYMNVMNEITTINQNENHKLNDTQLQKISMQLKKITCLQEGINLYNTFGIQNTSKLFELFSKLTPIAVRLLRTNKAFANLNKAQASYLFIECIKEYRNSVVNNNVSNNFALPDRCSINYANGMSGCDANFAIATAASVLAGALLTFGILGLGVVGGGVAVSGGIAAAYASLYVCQGGVVDAWKDCRGISYYKIGNPLKNMI